jgi:hypothetical protein
VCVPDSDLVCVCFVACSQSFYYNTHTPNREEWLDDCHHQAFRHPDCEEGVPALELATLVDATHDNDRCEIDL